MDERKQTNNLDKSLNLKQAKKVAIDAAVSAGNILTKNFRKKFNYRRKSKIEYVSEIDIKCEKTIINKIKKAFPKHRIFSEECGFGKDDKKKDSEYVWYIDPLDGTHNYIHGINPFGLSIALTKGNEVLLGVINLPNNNELYCAIKGEPSTLNKKIIKVSKRSTNFAMCGFTTRIRSNPREKVRLLKKLADKFEMVRSFGSISHNLAMVAVGRMELLITFTMPAYDVAAGYIIVEQAGGKITDFNGKKTNFKGKRFVISNKKLHNYATNITRTVK